MHHLQLLLTLPGLHVLYTYATLTLHLLSGLHLQYFTCRCRKQVSCASWQSAMPLMELSISLVTFAILECDCAVCNVRPALCFFSPIHPNQLRRGQHDEPARRHQENQPFRTPDVLPAHAERNQDPASLPP